MSTTPIDLKGVSLFLVGMMGAGKSTTGKILAHDFNYKFFDTDVVISELTGQSVSDIFATGGEQAFRKLETDVLAELSSYRRLVVATGGGIVLDSLNWSYLRHGLVVWLDVDIEALWERLKADTSRPLLNAPNPLERLAEILAARRSRYAQADVRVIIPATASSEKVVELIYEAIQPVLRQDLPAL